MKILFITTEYPPFIVGGLGIYSMNVCQRLSERNDVIVIAPGPENGEYFDKVRIIRIKSGIYGYKSDDEFFYSSIDKIKNMDFDVAICNDVHTAKIGLAIKEMGKPVVFILHRSSFRDSLYLYNLEKEIINKADLVVTVSKMMKEMFAQRAIVIHNGTDEEVPDISSEFVLVISRNSFEKRLDILEKLRDFPIPIYVIGKGTDNIEYGSVKGFGFVSDEVKRDLLSRARFVLHPADIEPFGLTILESVYSCKPVVCLGKTGAEEIVPVLKGWEWIWKLMDDSELEKQKQILRKLKKRSWDDVVKELEDVLRDVVKNSRG